MQKGRLTKWNDEKGFGFIRPDNSVEDVFFHISELQGAERRPLVGDIVNFNVIADANGCRRAAGATIEGVKSLFAEREFGKSQDKPHYRKPSPDNFRRARPFRPRRGEIRFASRIVAVIAVLAVVFAVEKFGNLNLLKGFTASSAEAPGMPVADEQGSEDQFQCQGKTRCTQMVSCEEAMFYLNNCPGSVTDGDGDGLPCEDQWCGH